MSEFLMKPRNDYAFKELMSVENVRIGFLSAILKLNPDDIKETHILNTDLKKMFPDDKLGILDVRLSLNDDTESLGRTFSVLSCKNVYGTNTPW